jgi:hypothetical protein
MKTKIYASFCGTGKTHLCDSNHVEFECWKYQDGDFPNNYVNDIKSQIGKVDYIFISTNPVSLKRLNEIGIEINLVYPKLYLKNEYLKRYKERGSTEEFINMLDENWHDWISELHEQTYCNQIELESGQYLSGILSD